MVTRPVALLALVSALALVPASGTAGDSQSARSGETVILPAGETHEGWFFGSGELVSIEGTVNGDVYAAGGRVRVTGTINGDLIAAGGDITIEGTVSDDIRMAGGNLTLDGRVGKDVTAAGGTILVGRQAAIEGNILAAGGNVDIAGSVGHNVKVGAGALTLRGTTGGDVGFGGATVDLVSGAVVGGDVELMVEHDEDIHIAQSVVQGEVRRLHDGEGEDSAILGFAPGHFLLKIVWALCLIFTLLVLVLLAPGVLVRTAAAIKAAPGRVAGWGAIGLIGIPVLALFLLFTVIGIPVGFTMLALYCILLYFSLIVAGVFAGRLMFGDQAVRGLHLFGTAAAGILLLQILTFVPILRYIVIAVVLLYGTGALLLTLVPGKDIRHAS